MEKMLSSSLKIKLKGYRMNVEKCKNIIWIQTAFLGDIILTTGAIKLLKDHYPKLKQHLITTKIGSQALHGFNCIDQIHTFDKNKKFLSQLINLKKQFRKLNINSKNSRILQPHRSVRSRLMCLFLNIPTISYEESFLSMLTYMNVKRISTFHECQRIALLLEPLGIEREKILKAKPFLPQQDIYTSKFHKLLIRKNIKIGIAPGSKWETKRWPGEYFTKLIEKILFHKNIEVFLLGDPQERILVDTIVEKIEDKSLHSKISNLVGLTSLDDLRSIIPSLNLLICNDSSPLHYASAFNIPTVALFGATTVNMGFGPLSSQSFAMERHDIPCRPCNHHGPKRCPLKHFKCMKELKVLQVYEVCEKIIESQESDRNGIDIA